MSSHTSTDQLPADSAANWRGVFGFAPNETVTPEALQQRYRERARAAHPDTGGSDATMMHLNRAREYVLAEVGSGADDGEAMRMTVGRR